MSTAISGNEVLREAQRTAPEAGAVPVLSVMERAALCQCEAIVRQGLKSFIEVGHALAKIRDGKLYKEKFGTFEEYCLATWDITDRYARNLWTAAEVVDELTAHNFAVLPETESQARPLTKLPRAEWVHAWRDVLMATERVTAGRVAEVVQRRLNRRAGVTSDTERLQKSEVRSQKPQVIEAGTRDEKILAAHAGALAKLRELQDLMPAGDGGAGYVATAINCIDSFHGHFSTVRRSLRHVEKNQGLRQKETEATKA